MFNRKLKQRIKELEDNLEWEKQSISNLTKNKREDFQYVFDKYLPEELKHKVERVIATAEVNYNHGGVRATQEVLKIMDDKQMVSKEEVRELAFILKKLDYRNRKPSNAEPYWIEELITYHDQPRKIEEVAYFPCKCKEAGENQ